MKTSPPIITEKEKTIPAPYDSGSFGWGILGFFFPAWGFIVYLCWKDLKPKSARKAKIGAIIGFCFWLISFLLVSVSCTATIYQSMNNAVQQLVDEGVIATIP